MNNTTSTTMPSRRVSRLFGQYIIKSNLQFKFSLVVFTCLAAVAFFVWLEGNLVVKNMIETGAVAGEESITQLKLLNSIVGRTCILGLAITFGLALFFSHFVAGPIYRFQRVLDEMKTGKLNMHVQLRKHDELKDVADSFNQALASLRHKVREERGLMVAQVEKLTEIANELKARGQAEDAARLEQAIDDFKRLPLKIQI